MRKRIKLIMCQLKDPLMSHLFLTVSVNVTMLGYIFICFDLLVIKIISLCLY